MHSREDQGFGYQWEGLEESVCNLGSSSQWGWRVPGKGRFEDGALSSSHGEGEVVSKRGEETALACGV